MSNVSTVEAARAQLGKIVYADWAAAALRLQVNDETSFIEPPHSNPALFSKSRSAISFFLGDYGYNYSVVFTSGATAAFELISRRLPWRKGTLFVCHSHVHNSVLGIRNPACASGASFRSFRTDEAAKIFECTSNIRRSEESQEPFVLFAFSGECNLTGARYPLKWAENAKRKGVAGLPGCRVITLVDAAKLAASAPIRLTENPAVDLLVMSLYKLCGVPNGVGALLIRKGSLAEELLMSTGSTSYFGGGRSVSAITPRTMAVYQPASDIVSQLEIGTPNYRGIALIPRMLEEVKKMGGMEFVQTRAYAVANRFRILLKEIFPDAILHIDEWSSNLKYGATVSFSLVARGRSIGHHEVANELYKRNVFVRSGNMCNSGASAEVLGFSDEDLEEQFANGRACNDSNSFFKGRATGVVRVSFGWGSFLSDANAVIEALVDAFLKSNPVENAVTVRIGSLYIYPIKSCGGQVVPRLRVTEAGAEGDRMFIIRHRRTRKRLTVYNCPRLVYLSASINYQTNMLHITGPSIESGLNEKRSEYRMTIPQGPLSTKIEKSCDTSCSRASAECGKSDLNCGPGVAEFLTGALNVPVELFRTEQSACKRPGTLLVVSLEEVNSVCEKTGVSANVVLSATRPNIVVDRHWPGKALTCNGNRIDGVGECVRCSSVDVGSHAKGGGDLLPAMDKVGSGRRIVFGQVARAAGSFDICCGESWICASR